MNISKKLHHYTACLASLTGYICLSYFTDRTNFYQVFILYSFLFLSYAYLLSKKSDTFDYKTGILAAILFRISLLFVLPNLSDDFYRFIWDGRLMTNGENPFAFLPTDYLQHGINKDLYDHLNSPDYYSIYPPVCQFIFYTACKLFPESILGSVVVMRLFILLAEAGSIFLLNKLMKTFQIPQKAVLLYALNPLVIIELVGNLHFEAVMIFFLLLAVYLLARAQSTSQLIKGRYKEAGSAISFAIAIGVKLLPLIFLPLLLKRLGFKKSIFYYLIVASCVLILFIPFFSISHLTNLLSSFSLYFQKFEFNASIYYIVRWIGYQIVGYNIIIQAGIALAATTAVLIGFITYFEKIPSLSAKFSKPGKKLPQTILWVLTCYFLLATTVHPWYITTLVALSVFSKYRFAIIWSALIPLTYITYLTIPYQENFYLIMAEYIVVFGWMIYEKILEFRKKIL
ncbi:MAG: hypothetical protein FVQ77_09495 [Cytophagales bacterium]|nr:hypothetical protein [Cytophagales bacterium]